MTWSFSRISSFDACPYKFFLTYLASDMCVKLPMFFSDFGSFIHSLLAEYYRGEAIKQEVIEKYLLKFRTRVLGRAQSPAVFSNYFRQGLDCLNNLEPLPYEVVGVEEKVTFQIGSEPFIGYVDLLLRDRDGGFIVWDHKSHALKPRSQKGKVKKSDRELDSYLRQLYLYSAAVEQKYGVLPNALVFNCYRTGSVIKEPFVASAYEESKKWALSSIEKINNTQSWRPNIDYYYCKYICDVHHECEYYAMQFDGKRREGFPGGGDYA